MNSPHKDFSDCDWLKEAAESRSREINKKTMMGVFHRMRVVERLFLTEHERADQDIDKSELLSIAKEKITTENNARQQNIRDFNFKANSSCPEWHEPYDNSDEVINDGVDWCQILKQNISRKDWLITLYFSDLINNIYKYSTDEHFYSETELKSHHKFSDVILSFVTNNAYELKLVNNNSDQRINKAIEGFVEKGNKSQSAFIRGITSISNKFDNLYQNNTTSNTWLEPENGLIT